MNLKKYIGKVFTSKFVGTGPSSYEKKNLPGRGLTKSEKHCIKRNGLIAVGSFLSYSVITNLPVNYEKYII